MNVKAEAYQEYNQAAVVDKLITQHAGGGARAGRAAGQRRQDHRSISTGNGDTAGMHKITGDLTADRRAGPGVVRNALGNADVRAAYPR